jgi:hypothetical protein
MNHDEIEKIQLLLCKINKVTAYHRHGNKIPQKALNELSNFQIDFESWLNTIIRPSTNKIDDFLINLPISIKKSFLEYVINPETNKRLKLRLEGNAVLFEGPEISFTLYNVLELENIIKMFTLDIEKYEKDKSNE